MGSLELPAWSPRSAARPAGTSRWGSLGLRWRLALLVGLPMLPAVLFFLQHASEQRSLLLSATETRALQLARAWSNNHEALVGEARILLAALRQQQAGPASCEENLQSLARQARWPSSLAILDESAGYLCRGDSNPGGLTGLDPAFLEDVFASRSPVVSEFRRTGDGGSVAFVGWRLPARPGVAAGAALAGIDLVEIQRRTQRDADGAPYAVTVFSRTGTILAVDPPAPELLATQLALGHPLKAALNTMTEGVATGIDSDGVEKIFALTQMPETGAKIAISLRRADVLGAQERATLRQVLILFGIAGAAILGGWLLAEFSIVRNLKMLTGTADAFGRGELGRRAPESSSIHEFAVLARAFNGMAAALGTRQQELEAARVGLETRSEALAASEQRFRDIAEVAGDFFWERDPDGRYVFASDRFEEITGVAREDMLGRRADRAGLIASGPEAEALQAAFAARRPFRNLSLRIVLPTGDVRWWRVSGKPVFDQATGEFRGFRGSGNEITANRIAEQELRIAKEAAEAANQLVAAANADLERRIGERTAELRATQDELLRKERLSTLGQLTATVAHELRNPLSAIKNTLFSLGELASAKGIEFDRPLARMERSIKRCNDIVSDLLNYSRATELRAETRCLNRWLDEILAEHAPAGIALAREFAAPAAPVSFDADRMRRVVINLLDNAAQAMSDPNAQCASRRIAVRTRTEGSEVELVVEDTGPGIAPENLGRVFEPLFSTKSFGTGLGLPTVKQIVEQHGGRISIASEPGIGTQVIVRLPLAEAKRRAA